MYRLNLVNAIDISILMEYLVKTLKLRDKRLVYINESNFIDNENFSPFEFMPHDDEFAPSIKYEQSRLEDLKGKYDLMFASFPFAARDQDEKDMCLSSLDFLEKDGIGVYLMPSYLRTFMSTPGQKFKDQVISKGFRFLAILNMSERFLHPLTGVQCTLVFVTKNSSIQDTFFAKYHPENETIEVEAKIVSFGITNAYNIEILNKLAKVPDATQKLFENISKIVEWSDPIFVGFHENIANFKGFENYEIRKEIEKLDSDYGGYKFLDIGEFASVNATKTFFKENDNAFYIPAIGKTDVIDSMPNEYSKKKPQNYFQVVVTDHNVLKDYLLVFFNSELGQQTLKSELSKYEDATIQRLRMSDIKSIGIPIPNLGIQEEIIENSKKIKKLKKLLNEIDQITSLRPISSTDQISKLNQIYESSIELSEAEKTHIEIKKGESTTREFKQTFSLDVRKKTKEHYIIESSMKTIAGFLNSKGGVLYVGVADNSEITGLEVEIGKDKLWKSEDKFLLGFKEYFKNQIGIENINFVDLKMLKISGKIILRVICTKSENDVFLNEKYFVRVGPSTEELKGPDMVVHIKQKSQQKEEI
jgi:hypothetical protein